MPSVAACPILRVRSCAAAAALPGRRPRAAGDSCKGRLKTPVLTLCPLQRYYCCVFSRVRTSPERNLFPFLLPGTSCKHEYHNPKYYLLPFSSFRQYMKSSPNRTALLQFHTPHIDFNRFFFSIHQGFPYSQHLLLF